MISEIRIRNFKCFQDATFELGAITLVVGSNSAGKSTLLQSLRLVCFAHERRTPTLPLNDSQLGSIGSINEFVHHGTIAPTMISATIGSRTSTWCFEEVPDNLLVVRVSRNPKVKFPSLTFLAAERRAPESASSVASVAEDDLKVGPHGEYIAQIVSTLALSGRSKGRVRRELLHPSSTDRASDLRTQTEAWMSEISPGLRVHWLDSPDPTVSFLRYSYYDSDQILPQNIGFGITYVLPIVIAGLMSQPGGVLVVENPESHLHPRGQALIGRFLGAIAASGVQVVCETHSDHVLNGLRVAAVDPSHPLQTSNVVVHYLDRDRGRGPLKHQPIKLLENGGLSEWPVGFFDQSEQDMARILKFRRKD